MAEWSDRGAEGQREREPEKKCEQWKYSEYLNFDIFGYVDYHILVYHLLQSTGKLKQYIFFDGIPFEFQRIATILLTKHFWRFCVVRPNHKTIKRLANSIEQ